MNKRRARSQVSEPLQIYISTDERRMLDALAEETGLSRAEILRRGLKAFAAERAGEGGPMQELLLSLREAKWPTDIASHHDEHLARAYMDRHDR
jgi:hypothetical protein